MKLTTDLITEIYPDQPLGGLKDIKVTGKEIDQVQDISACKELRKLNLSNNSLADEQSLVGLRELEKLTLLNLSNNKFKDLTGFQHFQTLNVLNLSNNELVHMSPHLTRLKQLKALILGHNNLLEVENIEPLLQLNTLVISHNKIDTVPRLSSLAELTKLSAAHNQLTQVPDLTYNVLLKELRLNDNKIKEIPETLRKCSAIEILDFGNNQLTNWSDIAPIGSLLHLHNLNLKGNPITKKSDYLEKVLDLVPSLRILDGERFDPKFLMRKKKQRENVNLLEKKQRLKRIKLQKEKKERKAQTVDADGDVSMDEAPVLKEKTRKVKGTDIAKVKAKRAPDTKDDTPVLKKKKKSDDKDMFFLKPEDNAQPKEAVKVVKAAPATKKKKTTVETEVKTTVTETKKAPVEAMPPKPVTKAQTGVLGVVDKTKKLKATVKKTADVVAELESDKQKQQDSNTGTGLDVGGWD